MDNPYESPPPPSDFRDVVPPVAYAGQRSKLQFVQLVAIFSIVHGALEAVLGLVLFGLGVFMVLMMSLMPPPRPGEPPPEVMGWFMLAVYGTLGILLLIAGGFRIAAGIYNYDLRRRTLGLVSFFVGLLSVVTCYCTPTSAALCIFGLLVYLDPSVISAFEQRARGVPAKDILDQR